MKHLLTKLLCKLSFHDFYLVHKTDTYDDVACSHCNAKWRYTFKAHKVSSVERTA
jgi:hypothetical protein